MLAIDKTNATTAPAIPDTHRPAPKLLDRMRDAIRVRHYSLATERNYTHWARRFILFHGKRHPQDMGSAEVEAFLSSLAAQRFAV